MPVRYACYGGGVMKSAIAELEARLESIETNGRVFESEGRDAEAADSRKTAEELKQAINLLTGKLKHRMETIPCRHCGKPLNVITAPAVATTIEMPDEGHSG